MSKVKKRDVKYPYVNMLITREEKDNLESFADNLRAVLMYIGSDEDVIYLGEKRIMGRAYDKIFRRLNPNKYHMYYRKISKRQIKQLIRCHVSVQGYYVKIPYLVDYIFIAIFELAKIELDSGRPLSNDVRRFVGDIRRNEFYLVQAKCYDDFCNDPSNNEMTLLREALNNDINGTESSLEKTFL